VAPGNQRGPSWLRTLISFQSGIQQAGPAAGASYSLIGAIVLFGGVGYAIDAWQGSSPRGVTIGLILGVVVGFYLLAKAVWHR
jgi:F0F1-type ATP synthase assembly protein I